MVGNSPSSITEVAILSAAPIAAPRWASSLAACLTNCLVIFAPSAASFVAFDRGNKFTPPAVQARPQE